MGNYCTTTSLDTLMVGVSFDTATSALADKCITWAEDEINKKLAKRFDVSTWTTTTPPLVISLCEQLSQGYMHQQLSRGGVESMTRGQTYIDRVTDNLNMLAENKLQLVDSTGSAITRLSGLGVMSNTKDYTPTFAEDSELNWSVDTDKLADISDSRD